MHEIAGSVPQLRRWQTEALGRWRGDRRGVVSVVTGAGKTLFAIACLAEQFETHPDTRVLVVVPTVALQDQWFTELQSVLGVGPDEVALHGGGRHSLCPELQLHIAVVNTARKLVPELARKGPWMVVADECHRYGAPSNRKAIDADWQASLGLSATPSREYDTWFEDYVEPCLGPVVFEYGHEEALRDGILSPFALSNYEVPLTRSEEARLDAAERRIARLMARTDLDTADDVVKRALVARARILQSARARVPAARALLRDRRGRRSIVFHEQIAAADQLHGLLVQDGHRAVLYHSKMSSPSRQRSLLLFRRGQADVLVTCRALDEGLDVPDADFGLICASTASTRQRIQRLGRLIRRSPGKESAEIATIFSGRWERSRLEDEEVALTGVAEVHWYEVRFE